MKQFFTSTLILCSFFYGIQAQTANTTPLPAGETVIGAHLHVGAGNEIWSDANNLYFNYRGYAAATHFWGLGGSNGKSVLTILNDGKIGIGIAAPSDLLHIKSTTTHPYIRFDKPGIGYESGLLFGIAGSNDFYFFTDNDGSNSLKIVATGLAGEGDPTPRMEFPKSNKNIYMGLSGGSVGIGTTDPGSAVLKLYKAESPTFQLADATNARLEIGIAKNAWDFASGSKPGDVIMRNLGVTSNIIFPMTNDNNDGNSYIGFADSYNGLWMKILNNKTVRIDGTVFTKELNVQTNVWADDVFSANYKLMSLKELETYINTHSHLPNVPTETEVKENGVNIAEMNATLLRKVEELTKYIMELNKKIDVLESENNRVKP